MPQLAPLDLLGLFEQKKGEQAPPSKVFSHKGIPNIVERNPKCCL